MKAEAIRRPLEGAEVAFAQLSHWAAVSGSQGQLDFLYEELYQDLLDVLPTLAAHGHLGLIVHLNSQGIFENLSQRGNDIYLLLCFFFSSIFRCVLGARACSREAADACSRLD